MIFISTTPQNQKKKPFRIPFRFPSFPFRERGKTKRKMYVPKIEAHQQSNRRLHTLQTVAPWQWRGTSRVTRSNLANSVVYS